MFGKKLISIILLLLPIICLGQYGNNLVTNGTFDSDVSDWLGVNCTIIHYSSDVDGIGRTNCLKDTSDGSSNARIQQTLASTLVNGTTYKTKLMYYYDTGSTANGFQPSIYTPGQIFFDVDYNTTKGTWYSHSATGTATGNFTILGQYITQNANRNGGINGDVSYLDDIYLFEKIDTLYTDPGMADETDNDSTKTLTEAFETRGSHAGGYFITSTGDFSSTDSALTIDSSFTKWEASGGTVTIDSVDFNSVTIDSLDALISKTISTPLNYENVTVYFDNTLTTQATSLTFTSVTQKTATIGWTRGDGDSVMVVVKEGSAPSDPSDDTVYSANAAFGSGSDVGSSSYVVYKGTGTTVNVTGLTAGKTYYVDVSEYDYSLEQWDYLATPLASSQQMKSGQDGYNGYDGYNDRNAY